MRVSSNQVSSVMLRRKKFEILRKKKIVKTVKEPGETKTECHDRKRHIKHEAE
jgi:hypothetical protein